MKNIYELGLFEEYTIYTTSHIVELMTRVPGGWIHSYRASSEYGENSSSVFIPFDNEFQETK